MARMAVDIETLWTAPETWTKLAGDVQEILGAAGARFKNALQLPPGARDRLNELAHAANLGTAGLVGYGAGALLTIPLVSRVRALLLVQCLMLLNAAVLSVFAWRLNARWLFSWALIVAGMGSGALMALAVAAGIAHVRSAHRHPSSALSSRKPLSA